MGSYYNNFNEWADSFNGLSAKQQAEKMRDHIIETAGLDNKSINCFKDAFAWVLKRYDLKKEFDVHQFVIYLNDVKHYNMQIELIIRVMFLIILCGYGIFTEDSLKELKNTYGDDLSLDNNIKNPYLRNNDIFNDNIENVERVIYNQKDLQKYAEKNDVKSKQ